METSLADSVDRLFDPVLYPIFAAGFVITTVLVYVVYRYDDTYQFDPSLATPGITTHAFHFASASSKLAIAIAVAIVLYVVAQTASPYMGETVKEFARPSLAGYFVSCFVMIFTITLFFTLKACMRAIGVATIQAHHAGKLLTSSEARLSLSDKACKVKVKEQRDELQAEADERVKAELTNQRMEFVAEKQRQIQDSLRALRSQREANKVDTEERLAHEKRKYSTLLGETADNERRLKLEHTARLTKAEEDIARLKRENEAQVPKEEVDRLVKEERKLARKEYQSIRDQRENPAIERAVEKAVGSREKELAHEQLQSEFELRMGIAQAESDRERLREEKKTIEALKNMTLGKAHVATRRKDAAERRLAETQDELEQTKAKLEQLEDTAGYLQTARHKSQLTAIRNMLQTPPPGAPTSK